MKTIIFDIDGTLANIDKRRKVLEEDPQNWAGFFENMGNDPVNIPIADLYRTLYNSNSYNCIIISGRSEKYRPITERWLIWNELPFAKLLLRMEGDTRPDHEIKQEALQSLIKSGADVSFVVDDRRSVVDMWRRNGIVCLQCYDFNE